MSLVRAQQKLRRQLKPALVGFAVVFIVGIFLSFNYNAATSGGVAGSQPGRLFARYGGGEITTEEFQRALQREQERLKNYGSFGRPATVQQIADAPRSAYEQLLQEHAEAAAARSLGIRVSEGDARSEGSRQVEAALKQVGEGLEPAELADTRRVLLANLDIAGIQRGILSTRLRERLDSEARPVEIKVAHVLVKTDRRDEDTAYRLALDITRRARAGEDFARLAKEHSEDPGSKTRGGEVGWASAMPPGRDAKKRPGQEPAADFVPEFTAAALRLGPGQVSDPVRSSFGYHVLKYLAERPYEPADKDSEKDPKKREEAVKSYRGAVGSQIFSGLTSQYRTAVESTLRAESAWLKGYLAEQLAAAAPPADPKAKGPTEAQRLAPAIEAYNQLLKQNTLESGPGLVYRLAQLYNRANQPAQAAELLKKWSRRSSDAEMYFLYGETLEKLKRKSEALEAYRTALDRAFSNPGLLNRLRGRFKDLGRADLEKQAAAREADQLARQAAADRRRQEEFQRLIAEQVAKGKAEKAAQETAKAKPTPAAPGKPGDTVAEVTVKTGPIDPKTGKPIIESITQKDPKTGTVTVTHPGKEGADKAAGAAGDRKPSGR